MSRRRLRRVIWNAGVLTAALGALILTGCCRKKDDKRLRLLFIGNSHTYVYDVPSLTVKLAEEDGYECEAACAARSDYYLRDHLADEETTEILRKGGFDFVILQEHADPFPGQEEYEASVKALMELVPDREKCRFILFECWARKNHGKTQKKMCRVNEAVAGSTGAVLAEVGKAWKETLDADPDAGLYGKDREHASPEGADLTARILWKTIRQELENGDE